MHPADIALTGYLLLSHTILEVIRCQRQRIATVAVRFADSQEIHTLLSDIVYPPTCLTTDKEPALGISGSQRIATFRLLVLFQQEPVASHFQTLAFHPDIAFVINISRIQSLAIPPTGAILYGLCIRNQNRKV